MQFPEHLFQPLCEFKDVVEQESRAVIVFTSRKDATLQGDDISVAMATSAFEQKIKELESHQNKLPSNSNNVKQEKLQTAPVSKIDPSLKEFAMKLGYTEDAIQQVLKKQAGKEVDQNILLRELISVSSPSLLQKGRPGESVVPSASTPAMHHRSEVVARGPSAFMPNPNVVQKSWGVQDRVYNGELYDNTTHRGDIAARGPSAQYVPGVSRPAASRTWPQEPNSFEQYDRTNLNDRQQEDEPFLYNQVVGDSAAVDSSSDLRHIVIDGSNVAMRWVFFLVFTSQNYNFDFPMLHNKSKNSLVFLSFFPHVDMSIQTNAKAAETGSKVPHISFVILHYTLCGCLHHPLFLYIHGGFAFVFS